MRRWFILIGLFVPALLFLVACASIMHGTGQDVGIKSGSLALDRDEVVKMPASPRKTTEEPGGGAVGTVEESRWSLTQESRVDSQLQ